MGRVLTNTSGFQYSIEDTENNSLNIGQLQSSPEWFELEINSPGGIGSTITTVARDPISRNRQARKGTISDLDSAAEFEVDLTVSHFSDFIEGFVFSRFSGSELFNPTVVDVDSFTVDIGSALMQNTLVYSRGMLNSANNGLHLVGVGSTSTDIVVTSTLITETAPGNADLEVAGFRTAAGDLDIDVSGSIITINSAANVFNNPGLNLLPGAGIFFGGAAALNRFSTTVNSGYARIVSIAGDGSNIVIDKTSQPWITEDAGSQEVEFYIGRFVRNVATDDPSFLERSFQFEVSYPNLGNSSATEYEYSRGNYCNTMAFNLPLSDKATISPAFIGVDTDEPTTTRATNAASALSPNKTAAFNTTQDIARLRVTEVDETGLTTDFKSVTVTLNNNVSPEKVLGVLGARFMNYGNFGVSVEAQALFTDSGVISAIRNNTTVTMDFSLKNDDGAIYVDVPSMTLGNGAKDFPVNETVLINLTGTSFADSTLNTSIGITVFPFIPTFI